MTPKKLFAQIRMNGAIQDAAHVKYSDYQLLATLNSVLQIVYNTVSNLNSTILNQSQDVRLINGKGELPDDFLSLVNIYDGSGNPLTPASKNTPLSKGNYRIVGDTIFHAGDVVSLEYKPYFTDVEYSEIEDELILQDFFAELIRKYMIILLTGGSETDSALLSGISDAIQHIIANRDYNVIVDASANTNNIAWRI